MIRFVLICSYCVNTLPPRWTASLGRGLGWFWFHVIRFRRTVVLENLRLAFGSEKSEREIGEMARHCFEHYGQTLFEIVRSVSWRREDYLKVRTVGFENMERALKKGRGVYALSSHMGNWEWVIGALMARGVPGHAVVKHSKNQAADRFLKWHRERMGIGILYESGTAKDILKSLARGKMVGFMLDQFMGPPIGLPVRFFGQLAGTAIGLALLSEKKEAPIVPIYSYRDKEGVLTMVIEPEVEFPPFSEDRQERLYEKTQAYNDILESHVRRHPEQWLWLHRRWKAYRGEPRWKSSRVWAPVGAVLLFLMGCSSPLSQRTPTGIDIPSDPKVAVLEDESLAAVPVKKHKKKPGKPVPVLNRRALAAHQIPFKVGEQMVLALRWTALPAGQARLEVRPGTPFGGRPTFQFWGNVLSSKLVDAIYHVDNTAESLVDRHWFVPYRFLLHMVETPQLKETRATFDQKANKVHYWSKRISKKWGDELQDRVDDVLPFSQDMFSALYYGRVLDYELGKRQEFPIYENKQNVVVSILPVANEIVQTKAGVFQCWKLALNLKINNVLKPSGDVFLWLSDDSKKYVVKFDAKLKLGSLIGELVSVKEQS